MEEVKKDTITLEKSTLWMISTFALLVLFGGFLIFSYVDGNSGTGNVVAPTGQDPTAANIRVNIENDDAILGSEDAEISIVEFSDFQCPFCGRANDGLIAELKASNYIANGDVNLVFKHFPLRSIHPQAQKASEASVCAQDQGKFWEYHDVLFSNQNALSDADLKKYASQLGLNTNNFNDCLDNGKATSRVNADYNQASAAGAQGTPYFVVYNKKTKDMIPVSGAVPFANLESAIQQVQ
jgi:protein-disulfide isomerase